MYTQVFLCSKRDGCILRYSCVARGMGVYSGILVLLMGWFIFGRL